MKTKEKQYQKMVASASPKTPVFKNCCMAFLVGGLICVGGQALFDLYHAQGLNETTAKGLVSVTLVFLSVLFTALGWYHAIAKHAGAGTLVPITGFANSIAAPAMEFKSEGLVLGLGAKLFVIAGPVLVYGISASVIYGVIYWICTMV